MKTVIYQVALERRVKGSLLNIIVWQKFFSDRTKARKLHEDLLPVYSELGYDCVSFESFVVE